ncbi:MAG TPA: AAA family ATPase [Thermoanaerobaculia bacterium]|nr:AAA family ATPase [Thermoanaerobaculia bacterium]
MSATVPVRGAERIRRALLGSYPLLYVQSWEEGRVERALSVLAQKFYEKPVAFAVWTCVDGWTGLPDAPADSRDPLRALDVVLQSSGPGFFLMKDLPSLLEGRPDVVRKLRDAYRQLKGKGKFLVMVSPRLLLPEDLNKEVFIVDYDLPDEGEVRNAVTILGKRYLGEAGLSPVDADRVVTVLRGQTLDELEHVFAKVFARTPRFDETTFDELLAEKEQSSRKAGVLEYVPPRFTLDDIGGLENLKDWLRKRQHLFSKEALEAGLPVPKGLLMMGMSGCGKSLSVKAIPVLWNLPLFRLDMNLVFGTANPEASFHKALKTVEGLAPAVLWIDEIEMAITGGREAGGGDPALGRIFSTFLTWMQEKEALVFVAATANRIHLLPAEFIRKGRFDQVFFLDLPNETERKAIFTVHLKKQNADVARFDVIFLAKATKGFNGAEIESVVQAAAIDAFNEKRVLSEDDVARLITNTVALSKTMDEQIKAIKSWAHNRAISASRESAT